MSDTQPRVPAGVSTGGQFATKPAAEAPVDLLDEVPYGVPDEEPEKVAIASVTEHVLKHVPDAVGWETSWERVDGSWGKEYAGTVVARLDDGSTRDVDILGTPVMDALADWEEAQRVAYGDTGSLETLSWRKPASTARRLVDSLVDRGVLSPAARDMDPRVVLDQHSEATAMSFSERKDLYAAADLPMRAAARELAVGDTLVLPGDGREVLIEDLSLVGDSLLVGDEDGKQHTFDLGDDVGFRPGDGRCDRCGDAVGVEGWNGLCGSCADAVTCIECGGEADGDGICPDCKHAREVGELDEHGEVPPPPVGSSETDYERYVQEHGR